MHKINRMGGGSKNRSLGRTRALQLSPVWSQALRPHNQLYPCVRVCPRERYLDPPPILLILCITNYIYLFFIKIILISFLLF